MDYLDFKEKARQNLTVAEWCYQQGHYDACCNRAYYAMFQAAIAVLASEGMTPSEDNASHSSVQSHFVSYFCNKNKIFPQFRDYLAEAQIRRNKADYQPERLNQRKTKQQLDWARVFLQAILRRVEPL